MITPAGSFAHARLAPVLSKELAQWHPEQQQEEEQCHCQNGRGPVGGHTVANRGLFKPRTMLKWPFILSQMSSNKCHQNRAPSRQKLDYTVNQLNIWFARPNLNRVMETVSKLLPFRNQRVGFSEFFWFLKHLKLSEMMTAWAYFAPSDGFKFNFNGKKRCRPQSLLHSRMWKLPTSRCILIFILNNSVWRMGAKTLFQPQWLAYVIQSIFCVHRKRVFTKHWL